MSFNILPAEGYVRLSQIVGNPKQGRPGVVPVSKSTWWDGCRRGIYPKPLKLGSRITVWRVEDIRALIADPGSSPHE